MITGGTGSFGKAFIANVLERYPDINRIVVYSRDELKQFQAFINQLAAIGRDAKENGLSLEETIASTDLTEDPGYEEIRMVVPIGLNRAFVLQRAWEETHDAFVKRL